jgi:signal transduction histidine kinase
MTAVILAAVLAFYYISRAQTLNDKFSLFIGIGFLVNALVDLMHAIISFSNIEQQVFIKYFIPQTWFAGRIFLSAMLAIGIVKYSTLTKDISSGIASIHTRKQEEVLESLPPEPHKKEKQERKERARLQNKLQITFVFILVLLAAMAAAIAISSLYSVFPGMVLDNYPLHRPYELPSLVLFLVALVYFYKRELYKKSDVFYKAILVSILIDAFAQVIMSYSTTSYDTAHNVAHILKNAAYFVNIIGFALSSIQYNIQLKETNKGLEEREQVIRSQYERLKETDKMQREFINVAAHELRTPIQPILGMSGLLKSRIKDPEDHELIEVTVRNARRLQRLTEEILDVTKIESHSLNLDKEELDLDDLIMNCINDITMNPEFKNKKNSVKISYDPKNIFVKADRIRVTQVISNLLSNALKFTAEGTISIVSNVNDNEAIITIRDTGQGIDPDILPKLFSKFTTKSFSGTGLGLFISKNIVEVHGGRIWAQNNPDGKGATFNFTLPLINEPTLLPQ